MVDDGRRTDGRTTDGRRTDGRTTEHGYTISSPCEPDGSGELINYDGPASLMLHTKFRGNRLTGSGEEDF